MICNCFQRNALSLRRKLHADGELFISNRMLFNVIGEYFSDLEKYHY